MSQRLATTSANTRAIVGDRIQTAMSARATPESLKRHARNINPTETMIATSAAVKAAVRRIGFSELISFERGLTIQYLAQRRRRTGRNDCNRDALAGFAATGLGRVLIVGSYGSVNTRANHECRAKNQ